MVSISCTALSHGKSFFVFPRDKYSNDWFLPKRGSSTKRGEPNGD
jgi:hypothetical protein